MHTGAFKHRGKKAKKKKTKQNIVFVLADPHFMLQKVALGPYCPVGIFSKLKGLLMLFCSVYHLFNARRHRDTASGNAHWRNAVNRHTVIYVYKNTEEDMHYFWMYFFHFY